MSCGSLRRQLVGPWRIKDDPDPAGPPDAYIAPDADDSTWSEIPPTTHIQPWLYPGNPYWGPEVRAINDRAWWYRIHFPHPACMDDPSPSGAVESSRAHPQMHLLPGDEPARLGRTLATWKDARSSMILDESKARPITSGDSPADRPPPTHVRLVFEAVDYYAEVWLNGRRLGAHEGNFASFSFDVTDLLRDDNVLAVRVTAPWDPPRRWAVSYVDRVARKMVKGLYAHEDGLIPPDANPIGIWRPVWLEVHGDVTLDRVAFDVVEDPYDRSAQLTLRLHVHNRRAQVIAGVLHVRVALELDPASVTTNQVNQSPTDIAGDRFCGHKCVPFAPLLATIETESARAAPLPYGGRTIGLRVDEHVYVELAPGHQVIGHVVRIADPHWWWPWDLGHPDLYRLRCTLHEGQTQLDAHEELIGLRRVELLRSKEALHYQINGVPVFLRGTGYMGALYLSRLTPEQIEADLQQVRACGLNLIRLHVHVARPEVYSICDRLGIMVWQDFELNWLHDPGPEFEERAVQIQREMVALLENHPSIVTWCAHNEPTALPLVDVNLSARPDPRLYRELQALDPSRPAFLCSGKQEANWRQSGDTHAYIGGGHGGHYAAVYGVQSRLVTEFGCEAPPTLETLDEYPLLARRLAHVRPRIDDIHAYQASLLKYEIEWYRRTRFEPCSGYIQFMFVDLYPQVGCGVLDSARRPRPALAALRAASQPVHVMLEYALDPAGEAPAPPEGGYPVGVWVINDCRRPLFDCLVEWEVCDREGRVLTRGTAQQDVPAQRAHRVASLRWATVPESRPSVRLRLIHQGQVLDENLYPDFLAVLPRPAGYPWRLDPLLGMRCYGGPFAVSSLRLFNTWYGRLAQVLFPVYDWAEAMLAGGNAPSGLARLLDRLYRWLNQDLFSEPD